MRLSFFPLCLCCVLILGFVLPQASHGTIIPKSVIASGGDTGFGGNRILQGTLGQPHIGLITGSSHSLHGGFWTPVLTAVIGVPYPEPATSYQLLQNTPNPLGATGASILFSLGTAGKAKLVLYDAQGRQVRVLIDETLPVGNHVVDLDATTLAAGVYFYRLSTKEFSATRKLVVVQ